MICAAVTFRVHGHTCFSRGRGGVHVQLWDLRAKRSAHTMSEDYQILAVAFGEAGDQIYTGGIENVIKVWDLRKVEVAMTLEGHTDTITGLRASPDGNHLLSNAMVSARSGCSHQADRYIQALCCHHILCHMRQ